MLTVRFTAADVKTFRHTSPDFHEIRDLILRRIEEAETLKEISKGKKAAQAYTWKEAEMALRGVLGDSLKTPPNPDGLWFQRINTTLARHGLRDEYLRELGEYAKTHLRPPFGFDFLIGQHLQIMGGKYDTQAGVRQRVGPATKQGHYIEPGLQ